MMMSSLSPLILTRHIFIHTKSTNTRIALRSFDRQTVLAVGTAAAAHPLPQFTMNKRVASTTSRHSSKTTIDPTIACDSSTDKTTGKASETKKVKKKKSSGFSLKKMMLNVALWFAPDYVQMSKEKNSPIFLSIKLSHYCEFARWAMDRQGIQYKEATYIPVMQITASIKARKALGYSGAATTSVPLLILPPRDGLPEKGVGSSFEIAEWAGLPVKADWIDELNNKVGPAVRRLAYDDILARPDAVSGIISIGTWKERLVFNIFCSTIVQLMVKAMLVAPSTYRPEPATAVKMSKRGVPLPTKLGDEEIIHHMLERSAAVLAKSPYLDGKELGGTDLAVASLLGPLLNPEEYGGRLGDALGTSMEGSEFLDNVRNSVAGKHCLKLFENERFNTAKGKRLSGV